MQLRATLLVLMCSANAAGADDNPDLLFNCNLAGQKRTMTLEGARNILWDAGNAYVATVSAQIIDAVYLHKWSSGSTMRHHIVIGRQDGKLSMEVDELGSGGEVVNAMVRETGTCSPEKIHPRNVKDVDPKRLRY